VATTVWERGAKRQQAGGEPKKGGKALERGGDARGKGNTHRR